MMAVMTRAVAAPVALGMAWGLASSALVPVPVAIGMGVLTMLSCTWNNLDDPRWKGRMNPAAALVRGSARVGYMLRTERDQDRTEVYRGPSHCIEWCVLVAAVVALLTAQIPFLAPWCWWWGGAVLVGCVLNVIADLPTPTGVPLSAFYNALVHRQVWKRHSLGWFTSDTGGGNFLWVPVLGFVTLLMVLGMLGVLRPIGVWMFGIGS